MGLNFALLSVSALLLLTPLLSLADARDIGVCYGLNGNNLPSPTDVIGLSVAIIPRNEDIASFAMSQDAANAWVNTNIVHYKNNVSFQWITIGNEVIPGPLGLNVPTAMNNIWNALASVGLAQIKVTTVLPVNALGASYPPSVGAFTSDVLETMTSIASILAQQDALLMINVYPYFPYSSNPSHFSTEYAMFTSNTPVVIDGSLQYFNLFVAMVDAFNVVLEKINFGNIKLVVVEIGWPAVGNDPYTSVSNAQTYNQDLLSNVTQNGTPRRPNYIMFWLKPDLLESYSLCT
ncbi:hypothetical protein V6N13_040195 [Hibiscus sabdariffa]|uniref:Uncharacterized protein n=2 Tax=Hibiscus sabdariffa TaxID=183260 RepID=A0ABR1ZRE4_9ROSI